MAELAKKPLKVNKSAPLQAVITALGADESDICSCDHCGSIEEVEFDVYHCLIVGGAAENNARSLAKDIAKDLWDNA